MSDVSVGTARTRDVLPTKGAETIRDGFDLLRADFRAMTRRAPRRFEQRDWHGVQADAVERLGLYREVIDRTQRCIRQSLAERVSDHEVWGPLKDAYSRLVEGREDRELAETFFNSVTRRIFSTVGVDPAIEFVASDFVHPPPGARRPVFETYGLASSAEALVTEVMRRFALRVPYASPEADARGVVREIEAAVAAWPEPRALRAEVLPHVFYRNKGAYVVGRLRGSGGTLPFLLSLLNEGAGVFVDAALLDEDSAALVFSFTRSYFHVEVDHPHEVVRFLKSIMPGKRVAELYTSLGYNKHGKTELYRDLLQHLETTEERFELARGEKGMVMLVFTMPSFDLVFKVIRDRFSEPKTASRQQVMEKYQLVFRHDRAGRLVDAQEFEHLQFDRERFSEELLDELLRAASSSVSLAGDKVSIRHLYTERRLTPLNLYLAEAGPEAARDAVSDYAQAIRDLAATNIFPGDILLKNFGVTRHRRVVFYDYDELTPLTDCRFRELPEPGGPEEEAEAGAWFYVGENDIFPEEFLTFLGLRGALHEHFLRAHADLLGVAFWRGIQERLRAGEIVEVFPYPRSRRLPRPVA